VQLILKIYNIILILTRFQSFELQLFNDSDVLDNYGLSFLNDNMGGDKKG